MDKTNSKLKRAHSKFVLIVNKSSIKNFYFVFSENSKRSPTKRLEKK